MDTPRSSYSLSITTDDTGSHDNQLETQIDHTDSAPSTYDILGNAISETAPAHLRYSLATLWDAFESNTSMPGPHGGLKPWPDTQSASRDSRYASRQAPNFSRPPREQVSTATLRHHYEPAQQPLYVSQQTSASSVRDMALRKGSPAVLRKDTSQPLKSALKRYPSEQREPTAHPQFLYPPEQEQPPRVVKEPSRFARFGSLFSRRNSSNKSIPSRASSTASAASEQYGQPRGPRRQRSIGWDRPLQQYDESRSTSAASDASDVVRQAKLAQGDVYEKAKTNIRRPPRGIKNWFDGFDVSSDEDDLTPVELPANEALPSTFSMFDPNRKPAAVESGHSRHDVDQRRQPSKAERLLGRRTGAKTPSTSN